MSESSLCVTLGEAVTCESEWLQRVRATMTGAEDTGACGTCRCVRTRSVAHLTGRSGAHPRGHPAPSRLVYRVCRHVRRCLRIMNMLYGGSSETERD